MNAVRKPVAMGSRDWNAAGAVILSTFSYAAVWAGLYVIGAVVCLAQMAGVDSLISVRVKIAATVFAFCTAMGVYLLDRVKLRDRWLDPADEMAHPGRFAFIAQHAHGVRVLMLGLLALAACVGAWVLRWGAVVPLIAAVGVLYYAGRPRAQRPRPKDILLLKNLYVAGSIAGFAQLVALAALRPGANFGTLRHIALAHAGALAISFAYLVVRVLADAVLCDLDDEQADRRFGTQTLPTRIGRTRAWNLAILVRVCAAVALVLIPVLPLWPRVGWAMVTIASSIALRVAAPARLRDWVDARFAIEAAAVTAILCMARAL